MNAIYIQTGDRDCDGQTVTVNTQPEVNNLVTNGVVRAGAVAGK